jgi:hypothetical protein
MKTYIDLEKMSDFINRSSLRQKAKLWLISFDLVYRWGFYYIESLYKEIEKHMPEIYEFVNIVDIKRRASRIKNRAIKKRQESDKMEVRKHLPLEFEYDIEEVVPEIVIIRNAFAKAFEATPSGVEKAEAWLYPQALKSVTDADIEALIYFKSKGESLATSEDISDSWRKALCRRVENSSLVMDTRKDIIEKAQTNSLSLSELAALYESNIDLYMFLNARDEEEDYILATFFRAVEWFNLNEFEPWVNTYIRDTSTAYQGGVGSTYSQYFLFYLCRSNLVIERTSRLGLEAYLYGICIGDIEASKPWKIYWNTADDNSIKNEIVDYIPTASMLAFAWQRINPTSINDDVYKQALLLLYQTQLPSGGWPLTSRDSDGDILPTCLAMHALGSIRPNGYERYIKKAKDWLLSQQNEVGCWHIQGAPAIMLNILCLEAISLADGNYRLTYDINFHKTTSTLSEKRNDSFVILCEGNVNSPKNRNFDENCYTRIFCSEFPNAIFCSVGSCSEIEADDSILLRSIIKINPYHKIVRLIDRDDRTAEEVLELRRRGVTVLSLRELESYLLDDEIISSLCGLYGKSTLIDRVLELKQAALANSVARGNPPDDLKSAAGEFFTQIKKVLGLIQCGNDTVSFLRDTMAPLVTKETRIYKRLRNDVFGF